MTMKKLTGSMKEDVTEITRRKESTTLSPLTLKSAFDMFFSKIKIIARANDYNIMHTAIICEYIG